MSTRNSRNCFGGFRRSSCAHPTPNPPFHVLAPLRQETLGNMGKLYCLITVAECYWQLEKTINEEKKNSRTQLQPTTQFEPTWPGSVFMDGRSEMLLLLLARPVEWFPNHAQPGSGAEMKMAKQESNLLRLPHELLEMILEYTSHRDTFAVALTCMTAWQLAKHRLHRQLMQILGLWAGTPLIAAGGSKNILPQDPPGLDGLSHDMPGLGPTGWRAQVFGRRYFDDSGVSEVELLDDEKFVGMSGRIEEVIALGTQENSTNDSVSNATTTTLAEETVSASTSASKSNGPMPSQSNWSARTYLHPGNPLTPEIEGLLYPFTTSFYPSNREWVLRNHFHKVYVQGGSLHHGAVHGIYKAKRKLGMGRFDLVGFEEVIVWAGVIWGPLMRGGWAGCELDLVPWEEFKRELGFEEGRNKSKSRSNSMAKKEKEIEVKGEDKGEGEEEGMAEVLQWEDVSAVAVDLVKHRMEAAPQGRKTLGHLL